MNEKIKVLQILGYTPHFYGSLEEYFILLAKKVQAVEGQYVFLTPKEPLLLVKKQLQFFGAEVITLNCRYPLDISYYYKLYKLIKNMKINVVHTHFTIVGILGCLVACLASCPVVIRTKHGLTKNVPKRFRAKHYYFKSQMFSSFFVTKIIAVSDAVRNDLIETGIKPEKIETIKLGINLDKFLNNEDNKVDELRKEFNLDNDTCVIGTISNMYPVKTVDVFIKAISLIKEKIQNLKVIIVGEGPCKPELEILTKKLNLQDCIIFTGYRNDVKNILKIFDIYVLSSRSEALNFSVLEAMASGKSCIAPNVGGLTEIIDNGRNGFLFQPGNFKELSELIVRIFADKELKEKFEREGLKSLAEKFNINTMVEKTVDLYTKELKFLVKNSSNLKNKNDQ
ncbi:MAG: glycosyltransferase family 4 protein [Candidatus Omnitrophica bacterium]|nr:glycosyltransferase family 4 protein [Candidatus Omnitrophota bacterium]